MKLPWCIWLNPYLSAGRKKKWTDNRNGEGNFLVGTICRGRSNRRRKKRTFNSLQNVLHVSNTCENICFRKKCPKVNHSTCQKKIEDWSRWPFIIYQQQTSVVFFILQEKIPPLCFHLRHRSISPSSLSIRSRSWWILFIPVQIFPDHSRLVELSRSLDASERRDINSRDLLWPVSSEEKLDLFRCVLLLWTGMSCGEAHAYCQCDDRQLWAAFMLFHLLFYH